MASTPVLALLLCLLASSVDAQQGCGYTYVNMDLSCQSNPTATMTWQNAAGVEQNTAPSCVNTAVAGDGTDQTTAPFPGGSLRFNNVVTVRVTRSNCGPPGRFARRRDGVTRAFRRAAQGVNNNGTKLDLLITMPASPTTYSADPQHVNVSGQDGYVSPTSSTVQALVTDLGYACLGAGVKPAMCASGDNVFDPVTGDCADGSIETSQGASAPVLRPLPATRTAPWCAARALPIRMLSSARPARMSGALRTGQNAL